MSAERLQKIISAAGLASRRQAEEWIQAGRVAVNGEVVRELGARADWETDRIEVDGRPLQRAGLVYYLLNKPYGVITSLQDPQGRKTVADLVVAAGVHERVYPVGRLDYDTEGLLLLTNDGELTQGLSHPRFEVEKEYEVDVEERPLPELLKRLEAGVSLADGLTAPARTFPPVIAENGFWRFRIIIHEGRNRQVRRMAEAVGLTARRLKRVRYGFLTLGGLKAGEVRPLASAEIMRLQELAGHDWRKSHHPGTGFARNGGGSGRQIAVAPEHYAGRLGGHAGNGQKFSGFGRLPVDGGLHAGAWRVGQCAVERGSRCSGQGLVWTQRTG